MAHSESPTCLHLKQEGTVQTAPSPSQPLRHRNFDRQLFCRVKMIIRAAIMLMLLGSERVPTVMANLTKGQVWIGMLMNGDEGAISS
jgi:hypothetical protein